MAETAAQKAAAQKAADAAQLKAAQAAIAKLQTQVKTTQANISAATPTPIGDRAMDAKLAAQAAAAANPTQAQIDNTWATQQVGTTGKTQAQLDAAANAQQTAYDINQMGTGFKSAVNPKTGMVETTTPTPAKIDDPNNDDPNKNKPGWHFNPKSGKWEIDVNPADTGAKLLTKEEWDAIQSKTAEEARLANEKRDAFALIQQAMQGYGFTAEEYAQLSQYIESALINPKIGPNQMVLELRALPVYKARFAGNETRIKNGLNALSEANYIEQENSIAQYLKAGGVSNLGTRSTYAKLIGGAVSPTEVGKRVNMAVDRVTTADPAIMKQIYKYNPNISQQDLVSYFLDPDNTLPQLEKKVAMGEIGAAATQAGLDAGFGRIEDLQQYGVSRGQAIAGYGNIGQVLPIAGKLGDVYSESGVTYDQTAGESEFFKSNAAAMNKRERLAAMERGTYAASAGNAPGAYSTGYLKKSSAAGLI